MTAITIERTARKEHRCHRCKQPIGPGTRYLECKLTPGDSEIGNIRWWRSHQHLTYAECSYPCEYRCALQPDARPGTICKICSEGA